MSMELDTVLHEVTRPPKESCEESVKRPNSEDEDELSYLSKCDPELSYFSKHDNDIEPYLFECDRFVYMNKAYQKIAEADDLYRDQSRKLSFYDAIPQPPDTMIIGGIVPLNITDDFRPYLNELCRRALNDYNTKKGTSFVFHDLVKCAYDLGEAVYYIIFHAKQEEDHSHSPAITTFQAQVCDDHKSPDVIECAIKI